MANQADWSHFDDLLRELGRLRAAVEDQAIPEASVAHLARNIELAAEAVRQVIDSPSDKELVVAAWELIVATETLIGCAAHPDGSERPELKNLRQRALDAMSRAALQRRDKNG